MTDTINYLTVALTENVRDDQIQGLKSAIETFRGVLSVEANVSKPDDWVAERRAHSRISDRLQEALATEAGFAV